MLIIDQQISQREWFPGQWNDIQLIINQRVNQESVGRYTDVVSQLAQKKDVIILGGTGLSGQVGM